MREGAEEKERRMNRTEKQQARLLELLAPERALWAAGRRYIAGVDEVGRGPLAGPVVAAAVILPQDFALLGVNDSKKLSPKRREILFDQIREAAVAYAIGRREPQRVDEINVLEATKESMRDALAALSVRPDHVLIDAITLRGLQIPQTAIVHGDATSISIAAASILAKVTRDREMIEMDRIWPGYGFEQHKGYGTKQHYEALAALGPCPIHRKTFL